MKVGGNNLQTQLIEFYQDNYDEIETQYTKFKTTLTEDSNENIFWQFVEDLFLKETNE